MITIKNMGRCTINQQEYRDGNFDTNNPPINITVGTQGEYFQNITYMTYGKIFIKLLHF